MSSPLRHLYRITILVSISLPSLFGQTAGSGFTLIQEIEVGNASTGGVNDLLTGVDLDNDGRGEIIAQVGRAGNARGIIYEWNGIDAFEEVWSVTLPVDNASSDQIQRLLAVADTDNDGYPEVFIASSTTSSTEARVFCYEMSSGSLSSSNPSITPKGPDGGGSYFDAITRIRAVVAGDADGDSFGELYVGNSGNSTSIEVWEADGNDSWAEVTLTGSEDDIGQGIVDMAPLNDLDGGGTKDDLAICEEQGALTVLDFSSLADPVKQTVLNNISAGSNTTGRIACFNLDNAGTDEIILSNDGDDGIHIFEWVAGSAGYDRDRTGAPLLSIGADILGLGAQDFDADGKGEIYYTYRDSVRFAEFNSIAGDFDGAGDFTSAAGLIAGTQSEAYVIRPSMNSGNTLLDGDNLRDFIVGTDGSGFSGWGEIFVVESQSTDQSLPVTLTGFSATALAGYIQLDWITESEIDNLGFLIERSLAQDGDYTVIADYRFDSRLAGQGSTTSRNQYRYSDESVASGLLYFYVLSDVSGNGHITRHVDYPASARVPLQPAFAVPGAFRLAGNFPNPFNTATEIVAVLSGDVAQARLTIHTISGKALVTLFEGGLSKGKHIFVWNGRDAAGRSVSSGIYVSALQSAGHTAFLKIALLK